MTEGGVTAPPVVVEGLWKRFGTTDVVADLSFDVRPGELLGFLGPNGAGKTTTMRMILDIIRPDRGHINVFGMAPGLEHQGRVGYLPEDRGLYRDVPAIDTLAYFGALRGLSLGAARQRAKELLIEVGLGDSLTKKAGEGGTSSVSGAEPCTVHAKLAVAVLTPSVADTTTLKLPTVLGVPLMRPVARFTITASASE